MSRRSRPPVYSLFSVGRHVVDVMIPIPGPVPAPSCIVLVRVCQNHQETKGVTVDLAQYKGGAVTVRVPRIEITDAQVRWAKGERRKH